MSDLVRVINRPYERGDAVLVDFGDHTEELLVKEVKDGHLYWFGWPQGRISLDNVIGLIYGHDERPHPMLAEK